MPFNPLNYLVPGRAARKRDRRYAGLGEAMRRQNPGGIGDTFGGYTPGPWGLREMGADQQRQNRELINRIRQTLLDRMAQDTQTEVQGDLQSRIDAQTGGGSGGARTGGGSFPGGGSFGGSSAFWNDLFRMSGMTGGRNRTGTVTITDLPSD